MLISTEEVFVFLYAFILSLISVKVNREILDARLLVCESLWIFISDKVYLVVLNIFLVLNFNSVELHLQLKFDPIQFNFSGIS